MHESTEWCTSTSGARVRVVYAIGAREYVVVHKYGVEHERYTRLCSGARVRVVHEWCTSVVHVRQMTQELGEQMNGS